MQQTLGDEARRLSELQAQNPAIRDTEIAFIHEQITQLETVFDKADVQLDALRIVVNNP